MPKRKADSVNTGGSGRGKAVGRPTPPRSEEDCSDDSDFCEVIEGPSAGPTTSPSGVSGRATVESRSPAPPSHPNFPVPRPFPQHGSTANEGLISMLAAGFPGAAPYTHPPHLNSGFGFPSMAGFQPSSAFDFDSPRMLAHQAGFGAGSYFSNYVPHHRPFQAAMPHPSATATPPGESWLPGAMRNSLSFSSTMMSSSGLPLGKSHRECHLSSQSLVPSSRFCRGRIVYSERLEYYLINPSGLCLW